MNRGFIGGLCFSVAFAFLAGCGGSQPAIGTPGTIPQAPAVTQHAARGKPWTFQDSSSNDLIYVVGVNGEKITTYVVSYANGSIVSTFEAPSYPNSLCSDNQGNVFMPLKGEVLEYSHGGTSPVATLDDKGFRTLGCAVDPISGDLAVANLATTHSGNGNIALYHQGSGTPKFFKADWISNYFSCTYDDNGNLVVDGSNHSGYDLLAVLPKNSKTFRALQFDSSLNLGVLRWDGQHVTVNDNARNIYQLAISGGKATVVGKTVLYTGGRLHLDYWLQGGVVLSATGPHHSMIGEWKYPKGRKPVVRYSMGKKSDLEAITVSVAASR